MYVAHRSICCQVADSRLIIWSGCDSRVPYLGDALAADHAMFNCIQFCTPTLRDLPNMGERETGKAEPGSTVVSSTANPYPSPASSSSSATLPHQMMLRRNVGVVQAPMTAGPMGMDTSNTLTPTNKPVVPQGWSASWRQIIWEKWRWGVLIALAVIVSRLSASS